VISTPFEYSRARSLEDALARLRAANGSGKLLAGGHSLIPLMNLRLSEPGTLIDIAGIPGLSGIRETTGGIEIGAGTVHHDVATSALLQQSCPMLAEAAASIGDPQVRNRGTLGGSLAHADPSADYPAAMLAIDADIHLMGPTGTRVVRADNFFRGLFTVDLRGRDHRRRSVQAHEMCGLRQARSACVALRHRRRGGCPDGRERDDSLGANRPDRRKFARDPPDRR
jgi:carbon-monoxide dehydrogenase medium subunit